MGKAYSDDLRRKLLQAHDRGDGSLRELAQGCGVSAAYAWKISSQRWRSGQRERVEQRHGPQSRISPQVQATLHGLLRQQPADLGRVATAAGGERGPDGECAAPLAGAAKDGAAA